jgi:5-methylcytosine-specific restriction endonuclease McrA
MIREPVPATPRKAMTPKRKLEVLIANNGRCAKCGDKITDAEWDANHIIPLFQGGADEIANLEPMHRQCHRELTSEKHAGENAKIRRLLIKNGPPEARPKAQPIRSRGFPRRYE